MRFKTHPACMQKRERERERESAIFDIQLEFGPEKLCIMYYLCIPLHQQLWLILSELRAFDRKEESFFPGLDFVTSAGPGSVRVAQLSF